MLLVPLQQVLSLALAFCFQKSTSSCSCRPITLPGLFHASWSAVSSTNNAANACTNASQLKPYFSRIRFNADQKRLFLMERQDVLFGFSLGFFILLKVPLLGTVPVVYGIAEASTAYLITKITDPPPAPGCADAFVESQVRWQNKNKFLRLPFHDLDLREIRDTSKSEEHTFAQYEKDGKMFT